MTVEIAELKKSHEEFVGTHQTEDQDLEKNYKNEIENLKKEYEAKIEEMDQKLSQKQEECKEETIITETKLLKASKE